MADRAEWARRVEAWRASGQSARAFVQGRGYAAGTLHWWSWCLGGRTAGRGPKPGEVRLVPLVVSAKPEASSRPLVVELRGGHRAQLERRFDPDLLRQLLSAMEPG
jgi:hypothetical protein